MVPSFIQAVAVKRYEKNDGAFKRRKLVSDGVVETIGRGSSMRGYKCRCW